MLFTPSSILLAFAVLTLAQDTSLRTVKRAFDNAQIPANLALTFNPAALLEVTLPEPGQRPITLHAGIQLPRNATGGPPLFSVIGTRNKGPFVVAVVDPDAPTPQDPTESQIRHFLAGKFRTRDDTGAVLLTNSTPALSDYLQPDPPAGSDAHRYVFLLYEQPAGFNSQTVVTPITPRSRFNISEFAAEVGLGNPIAGTFMLVAPDPSNA